jgi:flagellar basal-body rod protein FlgB
MEITTPLSDHLGIYLDISSQQLKLTAANMANVDTPQYRTVGIDFAGEMQRAMAASTAAREAGEHADPVNLSTVHQVDGLLERPDGNNVSMDREGMNMAEAQLRFRTGVELLRREFTRIQSAIQIDGK